MNREQAKNLLAVFTAFANGETVQLSVDDISWSDTENPGFHPDCSYRIKPKPHLRPWTKDEAPVCFLMKRKNCPMTTLVALRKDRSVFNGPDGYSYGLLWLLEEAVRIDEHGNEHPCGVMEEGE